MDADVGEASTGRQDRLTDVEGGWYAHGLDRHIDTMALGQGHDALNRTILTAVDQRRGRCR